MHPLIAILRERYCRLGLSYTDTEAMFLLTPHRDRRERILVRVVCLGGQHDAVDIEVQAKSRYPLEQARQKQYLRALGEMLNGSAFNLSYQPKRTIGLQMRLYCQADDRVAAWEEGTELVDRLIGNSLFILTAATLVAHVNYRLSDRGGTDSYRKLLPSRLAALTVCGLEASGATMH